MIAMFNLLKPNLNTEEAFIIGVYTLSGVPTILPQR